MIAIPLTVTARNEENALGPCLDALMAARRFAEERLAIAIELLVVLDQCTDGSEAVVCGRGVPYETSRGGKVEAQRRGLRPGPFHIFCDADVLIAEDTLYALCALMLADSAIQVAFPPKTPLPPRRRTALARALYVYNARRGFSSQRTWFSGKLYAIRHWDIPTRAEVQRRARWLAASRFYDYSAGMRVDDVYLSRRAVIDGGIDSLQETTRGMVWFRAPETWRGMYRYYRRLRMELERLDRLFPETCAVHRRYGTRRVDLLSTASASERRAYAVFRLGLAVCRAAYVAERLYYERLSPRPCDPWPPIEETKTL